jgi:hypothetical protein
VASKWLIGAELLSLTNIVDQASYRVTIYKNGSEVYYQEVHASGSSPYVGLSIFGIIDFNGSTDYAEVYFRGDGSGAKDVDGNVGYSRFFGHRVV